MGEVTLTQWRSWTRAHTGLGPGISLSYNDIHFHVIIFIEVLIKFIKIISTC